MRRVFIAVTHLLGAGHLTRAAAIGRALAAAGHRITLATGGMPSRLVPTDGLDIVQLPPVRAAGENFTTPLDGGGRPVDENYRALRIDALLAAFARARPDILVTELYPFGRRILAPEFEALIAAASRARPRPLVACSLRDILVAPTKAGRADAAHARLRDAYDLVLVHGDPRLVRLEESWPLAPDLAHRLVYTGYVDPDPAPARPAGADGDGTILVSGGSSEAALPLYRAAIAAAADAPDRHWHLLVGGGVPDELFAALGAAAPGHVTVERARADFRALLATASVFVGLSGYNTAVDLLATGARAVLIPFERGRETEQRLRAERLAAIGLAILLPEAELSAGTLLAAIAHAEAAPRPAASALDRDGAARSAALLTAGMASPAPISRRLPESVAALLRDTLADRAAAGRPLAIWWRDDDATRPDPALDRLLALADRFGLPLAIAAVPGRAEPALEARLAADPGVTVLVHGAHHTDHATPPAKKAEFGPHRPRAAMRAELATALARAQALFGAQMLPVLVPPWNRIAPDLVPDLAALGFAGLSTFGPRRPAALPLVNTHLDPVAWHRGGGLADAAALAAMWRRAVDTGDDEPIGLLTHHLVMDDETWGFCEDLLACLLGHGSVLVPALATLWPNASILASRR